MYTYPFLLVGQMETVFMGFGNNFLKQGDISILTFIKCFVNCSQPFLLDSTIIATIYLNLCPCYHLE